MLQTISYFHKEGKLVVSNFICAVVQLNDDIIDTMILTLEKIARIVEFFLNCSVKI
jgi:hypothetical protein